MVYIKEFVETGQDEYSTEVKSYILRKCLARDVREAFGKNYKIDI